MAGTFTAQSLADGQVAASETAIYTAAGIAYIKQVTFYSNHASTQTITVWIKRAAGTSRKIRRMELDLNESCDLLDDGETLELSNSDTLRASTTNATSVDYVVLGVVET